MAEQHFTEFEKNIIKAIIKEQEGNCFLYNIIWPSLPDCNILLNPQTKKAHFRFGIEQPDPTQEDSERVIRRSKELERLIISIVHLIRYLIDHRLIIPLQVNDEKRYGPYGQLPVNQEYTMDYSFSDPLISNELFDFLNIQLYASPNLLRLERYDFLSEEEMRFRKQSRNSWIGVGIAIFLSLVALYATFQTSYSTGETLDKIFQALEKNNSIMNDMAGSSKNALKKLDQLNKETVRQSNLYEESINALIKVIPSSSEVQLATDNPK